MLTPIQREELKKHIGMRVSLPDHRHEDPFDGTPYGAFLFDQVAQERRIGRAEFVFVHPMDSPIEGEGTIFRYGLVINDNIDSFNLYDASGLCPARHLDINIPMKAEVNWWAGFLCDPAEIDRFRMHVNRYYLNAPFLKSRCVTLLKPGVHV